MKQVQTVQVLPQEPDFAHAYCMLPDETIPMSWTDERLDRNKGYITNEEQDLLRKSHVAIAGMGGMGGYQAITFTRLGIGNITIGDPEVFDISNINRQYGATQNTIGKNKAFETARMMRDIAPDGTVTVYPQGITEETVDQFIQGTDVVVDMIEFWAVGARILLHKRCREQNIPIINCNSVGHRTYILTFTHTGMPLEEALAISLEEGMMLQQKFEDKTASKEDMSKVMEAILKVFVPDEPEYCKNTNDYSTQKALRDRLLLEGKAPIVATNPPFAAGVCATQVLHTLIRTHSPTLRNIPQPILFPGYAMIDCATLETKKYTGVYWSC